ncbi:GMP/IMP nucleotidase [Shewanella sp. NIFS-20-20]|uniref:GMP/IMP nucleotidase n=1 Tax=Shewanella sp. NIFS-20-20 TaxID=2853806 RepID=UPI001C477742|nr:GMP/IMP nucleotidase [Shewanella sp. NIFS-20-20]MBV7316703.1 GMP/IMP nucleotidase [Shewanella sp. NIFS-20-20]
MFPWQQIDTVLLDMDGTLLDLHFDNCIWQQLVPQTLSLQRQISLTQAQGQVEAAYQKVAGTLDWYCLDYWQQTLGLDIMALHYRLIERIQMRQDSMPFLLALKQAGKKRLLLTNAHPDNLALKLEHTGLESQLDGQLSSHTSGYAKERPEFWQFAIDHFDLVPERCLFIDDSPSILAAAKAAGIGFQLGINNPDSQKPHQVITDFPAIHDYQVLLQDLLISHSS